MRKIKIIITSLIVLTIVGSAFAFKAKTLVFCVDDTNVGIQSCYALQEVMVTSVSGIGVTTLWYKQHWDGSSSTCTNNCPIQALFKRN